MIRRPPRSTLSSSSAASDVYKRQHLIVTDLYMPEMNGAQLTKWLRAQVQTARTPIVICSAASEEELVEVTREVGADAFVSKEAGPDALAKQLHSLCDDIVW